MTQQMITALKDADQDFEWYPTTADMIDPISRKIRTIYDRGFSILDIGAGDGRVIRMIEENHTRLTILRFEKCQRDGYALSAKYAIEKASPLLAALPEDVMVVGTDFLEQTLIDKHVDVIFCNPPYSDYERWMCRILREAHAAHIFMVVPARWTESETVQAAIKTRPIRHAILLTGDFLHADRAARAKVNVIHFDMTQPDETRKWRDDRGGVGSDPFDVWFNEHFKFEIDTADSCKTTKDREEDRHKEIQALVHGKNQVSALVELYQADLNHLIENYQAVSKLDPEILRQLSVSVPSVKHALQEKIKSLKTLYWKELFDRLQSITERLTSKTRSDMLKRLNEHMNVDFTESNIYAVVIWALKNVNKYLDKQLLEVYMKLTDKENVRAYKSNTHMTADTWRYCNHRTAEGRPSHYALEYRLVLSGHRAIVGNSYSWDGSNGLANSAHEYIGDILTIANNLGFPPVGPTTNERHWVSNQSHEFHYTRPDGSQAILCAIRAFQNGNIHIKANQEFIRALNVEAGRLNGWIRSPREAAQEMGIKEEEAERVFKTNLQIATVPLLSA